jgi:hypothetical protein
MTVKRTSRKGSCSLQPSRRSVSHIFRRMTADNPFYAAFAQESNHIQESYETTVISEPA